MGLQEHQKEEIARNLAGDFITADDSRMTEILKGYVMQAVAYRETGEPFCADGLCRLYNAHWQSEVLLAQLGGDYEYCAEHRELFTEGNRLEQ